MTTTFTTDLPDAQQPSLGNGVEDEIAVNWTDVINYGKYDIQVRETGVSTWTDWASLDDTVQSDIITGRQDGEEYEVRMRTRTEHVTGAWTAAQSIVTKFPGAQNFTASNVDEFGADFAWDDQSDNEDGFRLERRRLYDSGWGPWREVTDLAPNTVTTTDDSVLPGEKYEYRAVAYTEHATAPSNAVSVDTIDDGLDKSRVPGSGWYVEVQAPSGDWLAPSPLDGAARVPVLNDYPQFRIPVARNEHWDSAFDGAAARLWFDGKRLPADEIVEVEQREGRTVLVLRGGTELETRVTEDVIERKAHLEAEDLIANNTSYAANVDPPSSTAEEDVIIAEWSTTIDFENNISVAATDPIDLSGDTIETYPTTWLGSDNFGTGERYTTKLTGEIQNDSGEVIVGFLGESLGLSGDELKFTFSTDYDIPEGAVGFELHYVPVDSDGDGAVDNLPETEIQLDSYTQSFTSDGYGAAVAGAASWFGDDIGITGGLAAGSHMFTLRQTTSSDSTYDSMYVGLMSVYDTRFHDPSNWDDTVKTTGDGTTGEWNYLDDPPLHPDIEVVLDTIQPTRSVTGATATLDIDDTSGGQSVSVSNDNGATWTTANNSAVVDADWSDIAPSVTSRVTIGRYGSRTTGETPAKNYKSQVVSKITLDVDLEATPVLVNKGYDDTLMNVLKDIADYGNFVFEVDHEAVEWTQPGQRDVGERLNDLVDFNVSRDGTERVEKAIIFGSRTGVREEAFTSDHDVEVSLANSPVVEASETVHDGSGTTFERGADYLMRNQAGTIEVLSTGAMTDATEYFIDYEYKISGTYTAANAPAEPKTKRFDVPSIPTVRGCEQTAMYLIQKLKTPVVKAEATVSEVPPGWSLVSALDPPEGLEEHANGQLQVERAESAEGVVALLFRNRQRPGDIVRDIGRKVSMNRKRL